MTVDEIKATYTMRDILQMYGMQPNRAGFIHCPFHPKDDTPSCKIYPKDFHCHACGAHGDVIEFVRHIEDCSFKEAFKRLGGSYSHKNDRERDLFKYRLERAKMSRLRSEERLKKRFAAVSEDVSFWRKIKDHAEPFTDMWCEAVNHFENAYIEYVEILEKLGVLRHDN